MTQTTLALYNQALILCGASTMASELEDTVNGRAVRGVADIARQSIHTECQWTFSTTRTTLATVATTTIAWYYPEEGYVYTRPAGALRIWGMSDIYAHWREEGEYLISDIAGLGAKWTFDHTTVGLWRPKFQAAFIDKLCSEISFTILNSEPKAQAFLTKYKRITLPDAMAEDSQTGTHQTVIDDEWLGAKFQNGGNPARSYG